MGFSDDLNETTNKRKIKDNEDISFLTSLNDEQDTYSNVDPTNKLNETCSCQNEAEFKENIKMFSAYVAASHSWQWQYLVMLANRQLNLMEKMGRKPYRRHMFTRKCKRVHHVSVQPKVRSNVNEQQASSSSHHCSSKHSLLEKPITVNDVFPKHPSNTIKPMSPNQLQEQQETPTINETRPRTGVQPNREETHHRPQNFFQNFPFASYLKVCIVLFFFNAPIYSIIAVALFGSLHATGIFNPFLQKFHALCERMGLTQRLSFTEIMNELRARRQELLQQQRSRRRETIVYEELQEQALQNSKNGETEIKPPFSNKECSTGNNTVDEALSSPKRTCLNPQWGPLVAFILPEHYTNFQIGTTTTPGSSSSSSSSSTLPDCNSTASCTNGTTPTTTPSTSTLPGCSSTKSRAEATMVTTTGSTSCTTANGSSSATLPGEKPCVIVEDTSMNQSTSTNATHQDLTITNSEILQDE